MSFCQVNKGIWRFGKMSRRNIYIVIKYYLRNFLTTSKNMLKTHDFLSQIYLLIFSQLKIPYYISCISWPAELAYFLDYYNIEYSSI